MWNVAGADSPPPLGGGLSTVTCAVPAAARASAARLAVNWAGLINVVGSAVPFQRMTAPSRKLLPITFSVNPGAPVNTENGERRVIAGVIWPICHRMAELLAKLGVSKLNWLAKLPHDCTPTV